MGRLTVTADLKNLGRIRELILAQAEEAGMSKSVIPKLDLVLEEVAVNVMTYAYGEKAGPMEIEFSHDDAEFCVTVRDWGTPFNPLKKAPPLPTSDIDERRIGGLGLMLVNTMSNSCLYRHIKDANELTFCFTL